MKHAQVILDEMGKLLQERNDLLEWRERALKVFDELRLLGQLVEKEPEAAPEKSISSVAIATICRLKERVKQLEAEKEAVTLAARSAETFMALHNGDVLEE